MIIKVNLPRNLPAICLNKPVNEILSALMLDLISAFITQITNHPWQSMRDRFSKKLESRLPEYIKKYKAVVLEKYGFTTSESSAEDETGERSW